MAEVGTAWTAHPRTLTWLAVRASASNFDRQVIGWDYLGASSGGVQEARGESILNMLVQDRKCGENMRNVRVNILRRLEREMGGWQTR